MKDEKKQCQLCKKPISYHEQWIMPHGHLVCDACGYTLAREAYAERLKQEGKI